MAGVLAVMAPTAFASNVPCPSGEFRNGNIDEWNTLWPPTGVDGRGVTMCEAVGGPFDLDTRGYLQIVDLEAGAKIRLMSLGNAPTEEREEGEPWLPETRVTFAKFTAPGWYNFIKETEIEEEINWQYAIPDPNHLFSTVNASFFKDADNDHYTELPFPHVWPGTEGNTIGTAARDTGSEETGDWDAAKRFLALGAINEYNRMPQRVRVDYFPTHYSEYEDIQEIFRVSETLGLEETWEATVSFAPEYRVGGLARRNYLGLYRNRIYIFTSDDEYTNAETVAIMEEIRPYMLLIQLDGGGSAQLYSPYGEMDSNIPIFDRTVPDVLAVYLNNPRWDEWEE